MRSELIFESFYHTAADANAALAKKKAAAAAMAEAAAAGRIIQKSAL